MTRPRLRMRADLKKPAWYHIGPVLALAETDAPKADGETDAATTSSADVYVYDDIGGWFGMTADDFVRDVAALDVDQIVLHLNTPGGDAMEGVAIANVLRQHKARVVVRIDGIAASAGSVVAMAGDEVIMSIGSEMMIHDPWGVVTGDAVAIENYGRRLGTTGNALASTYASRAGGTVEEWRARMKAETWYTAQEAVDAGLADRVAASDEKATAEGEQITPGGSGGFFWDMWDSLKRPDRHDLSMYNYAGRAHAPAPLKQIEEVRNAVAFTDEQLTQMRTNLGLPDDADEDAIVARLSEVTTADEAPTDTDSGGDTAPAAAPAAANGTVTVDAEVLASLRRQAERGEQARARQEQEDRQALVSAAVADGRIPPARREHWLEQLRVDPGAAATLAALEPGLLPVGQPVGHSGDATDDTTDPLYASVFGKDA
jgi:ATP-dependent protease ClpP protease subunit